MNDPAIAATMLIPSARPRCSAGNASVRIAAELAIRNAAADPLHDPHRDHPDRRFAALHPGRRKQDRAGREDREAEVVHPDAPVHVADPPEADDQHRHHDHEAEQHPQQVAGVGRHQRVEVDPAEDGRQRDDHDRLVDRRHQDPERRVRQRDPLVAVVRVGEAAVLTRRARPSRSIKRSRISTGLASVATSRSPSVAISSCSSARYSARSCANTCSPASVRLTSTARPSLGSTTALHPAALGEPVDQQRDPGLGDTLLGCELGDPPRPAGEDPQHARPRCARRRRSSGSGTGVRAPTPAAGVPRRSRPAAYARTPAVVSSIAPLY